MKVKVSYTIDYNDVPDLIETLLSSIREGLSDCSQRLKFKPSDLDRMIEDFQESRSRLEIIDSQMQDVLQITAGWLNVEQAIEEPSLSSQSGDEDSEKLNETSN